MNQASRFSGRDGIGAPLAAALFEAIIAAGQEAGRQAAEEEIQAGNAPENDVEPLTNAPVGYMLVERHPTMNIALYEHRTEAHALTLIDGVVATLPGMTPDELYDLVTEVDTPEELEAKLAAMSEDVSAKDATNSKFMGLYHEFKEGGYHLWAIYDLEMCRIVFGDNFDYWLSGMTSNYKFIDYDDSREDFNDFIPADAI